MQYYRCYIFGILLRRCASGESKLPVPPSRLCCFEHAPGGQRSRPSQSTFSAAWLLAGNKHFYCYTSSRVYSDSRPRRTSKHSLLHSSFWFLFHFGINFSSLMQPHTHTHTQTDSHFPPFPAVVLEIWSCICVFVVAVVVVCACDCVAVKEKEKKTHRKWPRAKSAHLFVWYFFFCRIIMCHFYFKRASQTLSQALDFFFF